MKHVEFFIAGTPKGQPRPRAFARGGKARVYNPGTAEGWKGQVAFAARERLPRTPIESPAAVHLRFLLPRPRGHYGWKALKLSSPRLHAGKPELDNLAKAVLDALVAIGFLRDDRQVHLVFLTKHYADTAPGCQVLLAW